MSKTYCGIDWDGMNGILDTLCRLQSDAMITDEEDDALEIAIQAIADILDLMKGYPIELDGDEDE